VSKLVVEKFVFVSHSEKDMEIVVPLCNIIKWAGFEYYLAEEHYEDGKRIPEKIEKAILEHHCFLVVWTKNSLSSGWVHDEKNIALKYHKPLIQFAEKGVKIKGITWDRDTIFFNRQKPYEAMHKLLNYLKQLAGVKGLIPKPLSAPFPGTTIIKCILVYFAKQGFKDINQGDLGILLKEIENEWFVFEVSYRPDGRDFEGNIFGDFKINVNCEVKGPPRQVIEAVIHHVEDQQYLSMFLGVPVSREKLLIMKKMPIEQYGYFVTNAISILKSINMLKLHDYSPRVEKVFKSECKNLRKELDKVINVAGFSPSKEIESCVRNLAFGIATFEGSEKLVENHIRNAATFYGAILHEILVEKGIKVSTLPNAKAIPKSNSVVRMFAEWRVFSAIEEKKQNANVLIRMIKDYAQILYALATGHVSKNSL
jgi:hypothetical protein